MKTTEPVLSRQGGNGSACEVLLTAGERLIESAVGIAKQNGDGHRLHDSMLVSVIRGMTAEEIREAIDR